MKSTTEIFKKTGYREPVDLNDEHRKKYDYWDMIGFGEMCVNEALSVETQEKDTLIKECYMCETTTEHRIIHACNICEKNM